MSEQMKKIVKIVVPILIGLVFGLIPPFDGLEQVGMVYLGTFVCVVLWLVLGAMPDWAALTACMAAYLVFHVGNFGQVLAPFADGTIWLLIGAFGLSYALAKTGLVKRIAFAILSLFPETYRGQVSAFYVTGLVITPFIPAVLGKGVIMAPIVSAASKALGYAKRSKAATGLFLSIWVTVMILGHAFLTGAAPVAIAIGMLPEAQRADWTWTSWFFACAVWFVVIAVIAYIAILVMYNPKKDGEGAEHVHEKGFAKNQLREMGKMSKGEATALVMLVVALVGWIFGPQVGLSAPIVSVSVLAILGVIGLIDSRDFVSGIPWNTIVFVGGILSLAAMLTQSGVSAWLATVLAPFAGPVVSNPYLCVGAICVLTYLARLIVVSSTATQVIMLAVFSGVATAAGINLFVVVFVTLAGTHVWHFKFTNNLFVPVIGATNGDMCTHAGTVPFNFAYMAINLVACLASVPLWQALGLM